MYNDEVQWALATAAVQCLGKECPGVESLVLLRVCQSGHGHWNVPPEGEDSGLIRSSSVPDLQHNTKTETSGMQQNTLSDRMRAHWRNTVQISKMTLYSNIQFGMIAND